MVCVSINLDWSKYVLSETGVIILLGTYKTFQLIRLVYVFVSLANATY